MSEQHQLLYQSLAKHVELTDEQFDFFVSKAKVRKFKKGQYLMAEGSVIRKTHFIMKGAIIAFFIDANGSEHIIQFGMEGWWISDIQSYIGGKPALLNVMAIEDSEVYEFMYEDMMEVFERAPEIQKYFLIITQNAFASFQERVLQNLSLSAEERYKAIKAKYPMIEQRLSQKMIASYLGMSAEFLSKIKKKLL